MLTTLNALLKSYIHFLIFTWMAYRIPATAAYHIVHLLFVKEVICVTCVIAEDLKSCKYCCYVICMTLIEWIWGNALAQNLCNSLPITQLELPDKGCAIKGYGDENGWYLGPLVLLNGLAWVESTIPRGMDYINIFV